MSSRRRRRRHEEPVERRRRHVGRLTPSRVTRRRRDAARLVTPRHHHYRRTRLSRRRRRRRLGVSRSPATPRRRAVLGVMSRHVHVVATLSGKAAPADGAAVRPRHCGVVRALGVPAHALRARERLAARAAAVRVLVLAGAAAVRALHVLRQLPRSRERRHASPAAAPTLRAAPRRAGRRRRSSAVGASLVRAQPASLPVRAPARGARVRAVGAVTAVVLLQLVLALERPSAAGRTADVRTRGGVARDHVTLQVLALHEHALALRACVPASRVAPVNDGAVADERRAPAERPSTLVAQHATRRRRRRRLTAAPAARHLMSRDAM